MNWLVCLEGGPFDGRHQRIPATVDGPPEALNVCLCPCCAQLVVLAPGDDREDELVRYGARLVRYRFVDLAGFAIGYRYVTPEDEAREFSDFYPAGALPDVRSRL